MRWAEIEIAAGEHGPEPVAAALIASGSAGVQVTEIAEHSCLVRGYLLEDHRLTARIEDLRWRLGILADSGVRGIGEPCARTLEEEAWAAAWKRFYKPMRMGDRLVVKPSWEPYAARRGDLVVELDPGMAFGTGTHATTRLCLEALERRVKPADVLLDWGTGSGILAIAAARLGAARVDAVDTDPVAVAVAQENARANGVGDRVQVRESGLPDSGEYDGVVANLVADPIIAAAPSLRRLLRPGGWLVASGIVAERAEEVSLSLGGAGSSAVGRSECDGWVCLSMLVGN